jgi:hypothetical protein
MRIRLERHQSVGPAVLTALCVLTASAAAQVGGRGLVGDASHIADGIAAHTNAWTASVTADYSAVAARAVTFNGASGKSGAQSANATITAAVPLNEQWFVPVGLGSRNLFLGTVAGAPIPDRIDTLGLNAGLGYHINDEWTLVAGLGPRFYRLDALTSQDVGVAGAVRATYRWKPNLTVAVGLSVEPDRDVPVLPAAGLRWEIQTNLTLSLMFPRSGLDYRVTPRLNLFVGGDGIFTVFRAANNLGDKIGQPQYNNGLGTYRDFRLGVGAEYRLIRGLSASVEGGYSFAREIDYPRIGQTVKFGSAPFIEAGLRWRF